MSKKIEWPTSGVVSEVPVPPVVKGKILTSNDEKFHTEITPVSQDQYNQYLSACKEAGFVNDAESFGDNYSAFNDRGYKLSLSYLGSLKEMDINVERPLEMVEMVWPDTGVAALVPAPDSTVWKLVSESSTGIVAYIGNITNEKMHEYAKQCSDAGFSQDFERNDNSYSANDSEGNQLYLHYEGNNVMYIRMDAAKESAAEVSEVAESDTDSGENTATEDETVENREQSEEEPSGEEQPESEPQKAAAADGVDPDLKAFLDSYEAVIDEYCEFMSSYDKSDLTMLKEYAKLNAKYLEFSQKAEQYDESTMSDADSVYYLEVMNRCNEKLLKAAANEG